MTLIVGVAGNGGVLVTWQQRNIADRRSEWWRRVAWSFERTFSLDDAEATLGWKRINTLIQSKLATRGDRGGIQAIAEHAAIDDPEGALPDVDVEQRRSSSEPEAPPQHGGP